MLAGFRSLHKSLKNILARIANRDERNAIKYVNSLANENIQMIRCITFKLLLLLIIILGFVSKLYFGEVKNKVHKVK